MLRICTPLGRLPLDPVPCGRASESKQLLTGHHNRGSGGVYFSRVLLPISPSILTFYDHLCSLCIHSWRIHRALLMTRAPTMVLMCTHSFCPLSQPQASSDLLTFFTIRCSLFRHEAISWFFSTPPGLSELRDATKDASQALFLHEYAKPSRKILWSSHLGSIIEPCLPNGNREHALCPWNHLRYGSRLPSEASTHFSLSCFSAFPWPRTFI